MWWIQKPSNVYLPSKWRYLKSPSASIRFSGTLRRMWLRIFGGFGSWEISRCLRLMANLLTKIRTKPEKKPFKELDSGLLSWTKLNPKVVSSLQWTSTVWTFTVVEVTTFRPKWASQKPTLKRTRQSSKTPVNKTSTWFESGEEVSSKKTTFTWNATRTGSWSGTIWCTLVRCTLTRVRLRQTLSKKWGTTCSGWDTIRQLPCGMGTTRCGSAGSIGGGSGIKLMTRNRSSRICTKVFSRTPCPRLSMKSRLKFRTGKLRHQSHQTL